MKQDRYPRRNATAARKASSASAILSGKKAASVSTTDYTSFGWVLLFLTFITITLISFLFTPYTHQLDEIKNVLLMLCPPILLLLALWKMDFSAISFKQHGALILLGLYFLWMWVSWLFNPYKMVGETVIWFNLGVATFTVIFAWYLNSEEKVRKTITFFVILGLVSTFLGLFLYAGRFTKEFYINMANSPYWQSPDKRPWATLVYTFVNSTEMYSFILNSDFYAAFLVMLIPVSLSMFIVEERLGFKILGLFAFLFMNVCLCLTNSNDSFISILLFGYPVYYFLGLRYVKRSSLSRSIIVTLAACIAVTFVIIAILMLPKLSATYDFKSAAFEGRRVLWGGGFWPWIYGDNIHGEHIDLVSIIFGTGPGGYRHYFPWFRRPDFFDQQINNVTTFSHNFYLDVLLETGLVGLILFIGFHVRVVADGLRQMRTTLSRTNLYYQRAVLAGLAGIAVQNFSSPNNRWAVAGMIYWCMFGLSMGMVNVENLPVSGQGSTRKIGNIPVYKLARWASLALAILFVGRCIVPGGQFYKYWKAATEHAEGMRDMDTAAYDGLKQEQRITYLVSAMQHLENAIKYNPTFATSYYKLGHVYNQIGNVLDNPIYSEKAIQTYEDLNSINANYSEVHLNLGIMYAQKASDVAGYRKKLKEATDKLQAAMETATGQQHQNLQEEYDTMQESLKELDGPVEQVKLQLMAKAYDHMKQAAHQSLKPNTQYFAASTGQELADDYAASNQPEKAKAIKEEIKKYYRSILEYKPMLAEVQADQKLYYSKAQRNLLALDEETGDINGTIGVLKGMVHDNPDNDLMLQALLEAFDRAKKPKEKLEYLESAVHSDPTDALLRYDLALAYKGAGQNDKYLLELRRVEVLKPGDPKLLQEIEDAYKAAGKADKASEYEAKLTKLGVTPKPAESPQADAATTSANQTSDSSGTTAPAALESRSSSTTTSAAAVPEEPRGFTTSTGVTTGKNAPVPGGETVSHVVLPMNNATSAAR